MARTFATALRCVQCQQEYELGPLFVGCSSCEAAGRPANLEVIYDYAAIARAAGPDVWRQRPRGMWRFHELLPAPPAAAVSMGEGDTPLLKLDRLGPELGLDGLYVKDESRNPTWSYKDRLAASAIAMASQFDSPGVVTASTGNHGAATAAYAARQGLPCIVLTLASIPASMKALMQSYGAMVVSFATAAERWVIMRELVERWGWYPTGNFTSPPIGSNPYGIEGYKTLAAEVCEALGWEAPEWVIVPASYGDGLFGTWKGFRELYELGFIRNVPRIVAAEAHGPLAHALAQQLDYPVAVPAPASIALSIATPVTAVQALIALRQSRGLAMSVPDAELIAMQQRLGRTEGLYAEPASVAAVSAAAALREGGHAQPGDRIVAVLTSSGLKDPAVTNEALPAIPTAAAELQSFREVLATSYNFALADARSV